MAEPHPFFLVLLSCLWSILPAHADSFYNTGIQQAHQEFLKLKIDSGRNFSQHELSTNPTNATGLLVANYADFLTLCVQQDPKVYDELLDRQENRLAQLENLKDKSVWRNYSVAEVRMQIGICKLLYGNKLSAAWDIRQAYLLYTSIARTHPDFIPNKKTLGMLQVFIGSVPDNYKWFLNIIGMKGSINTGLANLKEAASQENPFQSEAKIIYALTLQLVDQKYEAQALSLIEKVCASQPDNLLYRFAAIHLYKKTKHSEEALRHFRDRPTGKQYLDFPYLRHMAADLYLFRGNYEESVEQNLLFLKQHKGEHYLKAANFKLYLAYYLSNHQPKALWYYKQISKVGTNEIEEDKYAAKFVEQQTKPVKPLLLARLQSDGGYYHSALKSLKLLDTTNAHLPIRAEFTYRKARVYHGLLDTAQAVKYYKSTISISGDSDLYFAPHAALQLGYLYKEKKQPELAKAYFNKAISYKNHEYKNSIDAKAKLALSTL